MIDRNQLAAMLNFLENAFVSRTNPPPVVNARRKIERLDMLSELDGLVVVLVRPRNPLNIGAAARAMSNFGAHRLRLVNPFAEGFRGAKSAVGASDLLSSAEEFTTVAEAVADCALVVGTTAVRNRALQQPVRHLDEPSGSAIRQQLKTARVALLFGSEKIGLTNKDFSHCHWLLNIPTKEKNISMNLGQSVAVCLYELARSVPEPAGEKVDMATAGQTEQITEALLEALRISGYVKPGTDAMFEKKARWLILRFGLEAYDAKLLLGMFRQIVWKLRQPMKP
jgi:TrmH family RNA methyltransferase